MNRRNVIKWVRALRSSQYPQAQGQLGIELDGVKHYCPLGLAGELGGCGRWTSGLLYFERDINGNRTYSLLSRLACGWLGLPGVVGPYSNDIFDIEVNTPDPSRVSELNDAGWSFADIANAIMTTYGITEEELA